MNRPLTATEQSLADIYRAQLQSLADDIERESTAAAMTTKAMMTRGLVPRLDHLREKRRKRAEARAELWQQAYRSNPMGLGVVELFILRLVIGQLLSWIMRHWLGDDDADQDD